MQPPSQLILGKVLISDCAVAPSGSSVRRRAPSAIRSDSDSYPFG